MLEQPEPDASTPARRLNKHYKVTLSAAQDSLLREEAWRRGIKCAVLVQRMIETVVSDHLINAVLDDRPRPGV